MNSISVICAVSLREERRSMDVFKRFKPPWTREVTFFVRLLDVPDIP